MTMNYFIFSFFITSSCLALDTEWWKHTTIYEILPYSFKDSNGDGIGDIKGITSKLDHFVDLGIETIHLTPIYASTFRDMGYDVTDYYAINPMYGTMEDFDELMAEVKKRNMKLLLDLVINHSGSEHEWFQKSLKKIDPYTDFYVWKESKGFNPDTQSQIPPNRWISIFGGSGWTWNEGRKQFYFHQFLPEQPDFNLNNEILVDELKKMIKFWLDKGVGGFRLDAVTSLFEDKFLRDDGYDFVNYRQTNQDETYEFVHRLREFMDEYSNEQGDFERIFLPEARTHHHFMIRYFDRPDYHITQLPYIFYMQYMRNEVPANDLDSYTHGVLQSLPKNAVALWMTEDHDNWRTGSRIRPEYSDILTTISMMLPGSVGCYYGQEIAMVNGYIREDQIRDYSGHGGRDPARLIMQWDGTLNGGFSDNSTSTYLPSNTDYFVRNVETQKRQKISHYQLFKDLSAIRKTNTFKYGNFKKYIVSDFVYSFTRSYKTQIYVIVVNLSTLLSRVQLSQVIKEVPPILTVAAASVNSGYEKGFQLLDEVSVGFVMRPLSCVVLKGSFLDDFSK